MWETIKEAINGENGIGLILLTMLILLLAIYLVKGKYLKINTGTVKIGADEKERAILRQQNEWVYTYIHGLVLVIQTKFKGLGVPTSTIMQATGLTAEEIDRL